MRVPLRLLSAAFSGTARLKTYRAIVAGAFMLGVLSLARAYEIDGHVLSTGTSVQSSNSCYRLDAVIGEPVAGFSSNAIYAISAGFLATSPPTDNIFANSFEDCTP